MRRPRFAQLLCGDAFRIVVLAAFDVCHQVLAGIIAVIGMISLGKPIIGAAELPSR
jgi:hypothetical protein